MMQQRSLLIPEATRYYLVTRMLYDRIAASGDYGYRYIKRVSLSQ